MDASTFDAWTRRRFGLAIGGASLLGVADRLGAEAKGKKKKKKVRCRKELQTCDPNDKDKLCCGGLNCDVFGRGTGFDLHCCLGLRQKCSASQSHCCGDLLCGEVTSLSGKRCCAGMNQRCAADEDCCAGASCFEGDCLALSDRALKTTFGSIDPMDMLARVRELPISTWNYTSDDASVRHIGPMAQYFAALFGVGADDRHIHPLDEQGVALAAIQALATELARLQDENARLTERIERLERNEG
jgi:hypothetical protein